MTGQELKDGLRNLVENWKELAVPEHGKWVKDSDKL
jgi:hypothetical protein